MLSKTRYRKKDSSNDRSDGPRERRRKQLLDDFTERREYCKLKEDALDRTVCGELALEEAVDRP